MDFEIKKHKLSHIINDDKNNTRELSKAKDLDLDAEETNIWDEDEGFNKI